MKDHQTRRLDATTGLHPPPVPSPQPGHRTQRRGSLRWLRRPPAVRRPLRVPGRPRQVSTWAERYCQGEGRGFEFRHPLQTSGAGPRWLAQLDPLAVDGLHRLHVAELLGAHRFAQFRSGLEELTRQIDNSSLLRRGLLRHRARHDRDRARRVPRSARQWPTYQLSDGPHLGVPRRAHQPRERLARRREHHRPAHSIVILPQPA